MTHLGVYYAPEHSRQADRDYIAALQPPVIRLLDPDVQQIADMHALCPNAIIAPRTWVIDDNSGAAVRNLMADPIGTGRDHAQQYTAQWDRWTREAIERGLRLPNADKVYFNAANEPNQGGTPDKIAAYNVAFLDRCTELGICAAALCLGVGWPDNTGPDTPVYWKPYADAGLVQAIKEGNHWLELHEYFYKTGPQDGWRWLAGRHLQCPFDVPILLGEIGIDNYVDKARWDKEGGNRGWQGHVSPDVYAEMIEYHIRGSDRRVVAALPFITDYRNNSWESFDTATAHNALLARKDRMIPQVQPIPSQPPTPPIKPGEPTPAYVKVTSGANIRSEPKTGKVLIAVPYAEQVAIVGVDSASGWNMVRYRSVIGWMSPDLVQGEPVAVKPTPQPEQGDKWGRAWPIVLKIEGGLNTDPNDTGNYYQGKLVGTKYGISAAVWGGQYDIPNLTKEQALSIYKTAYWDKANCEALPWPMCLIHFDTAINHGTGVAQAILSHKPTPEEIYLGLRLLRYVEDPKWKNFGIAWGNRVEHLDDIVDGEVVA